MFYDEIKIYDDGGCITFEQTDGTPIATEPKGTIRIIPIENEGMSFVRTDGTGKTVAAVEDVTKIQNALGAAYGANYNDVRTALAAFFFEVGGGSSPVLPDGVTIAQDVYVTETTTIAGNSRVIHSIDTSKNQVIYVRAEASCGKSGITGNATRFAGRGFSVNASVITPSASTQPDTNITAGFNTPVLAISTSGTDIVITVTNATQDTSWVVSYTIKIFELP